MKETIHEDTITTDYVLPVEGDTVNVNGDIYQFDDFERRLKEYDPMATVTRQDNEVRVSYVPRFAGEGTDELQRLLG